MIVAIVFYQSFFLESLPLPAVDVDLDAGLGAADEAAVPQGEQAEGDRHARAQQELEHDGVVDPLVLQGNAPHHGHIGVITNII